MAPTTVIDLPLAGRRIRGRSIDRATGQVIAGDRSRLVEYVLELALGDDHAAVLAGPGTDVDDVIGYPNRFFVMLDHDERVADIAEAHQCFDQLLVVPLMEADRGLVENVEDADQARPDLGGEPDPLCLSPGQRGSRAG